MQEIETERKTKRIARKKKTKDTHTHTNERRAAVHVGNSSQIWHVHDLAYDAQRDAEPGKWEA